MENYEGWVCLHRKILDNKVFYNPESLQLFLYLILMANHKENKIFGITLKRGQLITGRKSLANSLNQKESSIYKRLLWLQKNELIHLKSNNKMTIISICNYDKYNSQVTTDEQQGNNKVTTKEQQGSTNNNVNNGNNVNNENNNYKKIFDFYQTLNLIKHKNYTKTMSESIRLFIKNTKSTEEECMEALKKHSKVVENSKKEEYPIKARTFSEFFGQKVFGGKELIGEQYINGGKYFDYTPKKVIILPEHRYYVSNRERAQNG